MSQVNLPPSSLPPSLLPSSPMHDSSGVSPIEGSKELVEVVLDLGQREV